MVQWLADKRHWCVIATLGFSAFNALVPVFKDYPSISAGLVAAASLMALVGHVVDTKGK